MPHDFLIMSRRALIGLMAAGTLVSAAHGADLRPGLKVWRDPNCGCCPGWVEHGSSEIYDVSLLGKDD